MDFWTLDDVATVRDATKLWEDNNSAWARWMNMWYVKNRGLDEIFPKIGDSCERKAILGDKAKIKRRVELWPNKMVVWKGEGEKANAKNIF